MKFSELKEEQLLQLSTEQKTRIVLGYDPCEDAKAEVAFLLGGKPVNVQDRVRAAAELYHSGRVQYILPCGGVKWEFDGEEISEALYMSRMLQQLGVPEEAIILENESRTTTENMLYGLIQVERKLRLRNLRRIGIVTSAWHLHRSVATAEWLFPRTVEAVGFSAHPMEEYRRHWQETEWIANYVDRELPLIQRMVKQGIMEDIEL